MEKANIQEHDGESEKFIEVPDAENDIIEKTISPLGRWQVFVSIISCMVKFPVAWIQLSIVFIAPPASFTCVDNTTNTCSENCTSYVYDRSIFTETIITEWDLVCDKAYMANLAQTVTMLGILSGNVLFGYFSDKFGRRNPLIAGVLLQIVCGMGAAFSKWFILFLVMRFFTAFATGGTMVTSFVLVMEIVGAKWRTTFGIIYQIPFSFGHLLLPVFAYYLREWRYFHVAICIPSILLLSYYWVLPESPRWLLTVGKHEKAIQVLEKAAHHNRLTVENIQPDVHHHVQKKEPGNDQQAGNIVDLFRTPIIRMYTICIGFNWFASGLCFFGGAQYIGQLGGNIFVNVALSAVIQIPGTLFSIWSLQAWGRRNTLIFSNLLSAGSCILIGLVPPQPAWIRSGLSCVDMFALAISFPTVYIYSGELFPTVVRNIGVGSSSMFARAGSMVAPFVAGLVLVREWLPMAVFGVVPLIGAALCLKLPETVNCKLPDTVEEAEELAKKK
ncbi:organic cation transporter protein-like [Zophobas morio]|uniref:organic cation transporter protein-like n=1 Tax=Zophobas morio TaxID=2755281 RepID=UPI003082F32A